MLEILKSGHGGARPGAGKPKGHRSAKSLDKEAARALLREMVIANMGPMIEAQIANSRGIKYLMVREKSGKFVRVTEAMAGSLADEAIVEVWEKDPSVQAFTDLLNRTIDKPIEQVQADVTANIVYRWKAEE